MDSFFGIGLPELILILLLSGIVMGPHRIRHVAHTIGRTTAQLQRVSRQFARQLNAELDALDDDMVRKSFSDMRDLQREVQELRRELGSVPNSLRGQGKGLLDETEASLKQSSSTSAEDAVIESPDPAPVPTAPSEQDPVTTPPPVQVATSLPNPTDTPAPDPAAPSEQEPVATPAPVQVATSLPNPTATPVPDSTAPSEQDSSATPAPSLPKAIEVPGDTD
jgi:Sec-independent protein translocase protein TatA